MKAIKGNKVYTIDATQKARYQNDGFDIQDDDGKIIAHGKGKTISYDEYQKVMNELEELKAEQGVDPDPLDSMTIDELKAYAAEKEIDLGQATSQAGILKKIKAALREGE